MFNTALDIPKLLRAACHRNLFKQGISCLGNINKLEIVIKDYIKKANERSEIGVLTKQRIDKITDKKIKTPQNVLENSGKLLTILQGKAGCGKTLMLTRIFYAIVASGHHCRLLTYNNLLAFDLKQCGRYMPVYRNTNASIHTLHYYFYHLSKKMGIHALFTEKRLQELMTVCEERLVVADEFIYSFKEEMGNVPEENVFWEKYGQYIDPGDKEEIRKYIKFVNAKIYGVEDDSEIKKMYLQQRKDLLANELGNELFLADYNKVLETLFNMLDNPYEFYEKHKIKNRRELLSLMSKTDRMSEEDQKKEYEYVEFSNDLKNAIMHAKWSKSILIDEAQDCNNYEKLILMKMYGAENIIITSGGKDQLIRTSLETDWKVALNKPIPHNIISLGGRSYRQKANVVKFVNALADYYKFATPINSANESKGLGRVIIDTRNSVRGFSNELLEELRNAGKVLGCSDYENCMVLLPTTGYSSKTKGKAIVIDELDNVDIIDKTTNRKLDVEFSELVTGNRKRQNDLGTFIDFYIYDNLSSGAGYAVSIADDMEEVLEETRKILSDCKCGSACYQCLKHYGNQFVHGSLDRFAALELLNWGMESRLPKNIPQTEQARLIYPFKDILENSGIELQINSNSIMGVRSGKQMELQVYHGRTIYKHPSFD